MGYIAFNEEDASILDRTGSVPPEIFPWGTHVELEVSAETAIAKALGQRTSTATRAATQDTVWYILEVSFHKECVAEAFSRGLLHWSGGMKQLEWYLPLALHGESAPGVCFPCAWSRVTIAPTGVQCWASRVLDGELKLRTSAAGTCAGCLHEGDLWHGTRFFNYQGYCASCWNASIEEKAASSLHELHQVNPTASTIDNL